ncbi:MAG: glycosyltransferase family 2 protein [Desulfobacterales bacterium]|nr:glycosyltransferase family 2 protein [Desulfobacterales bacterium]MCP4163552.1 glycosyltransferase family 2 protein [Deltaproteobacteria bacterium]
MKNKYIIISPVRNEEKYIEATIQSVLNQTILPDLYIIVDDGSTDRTREIVEKYSKNFSFIKYVHKKNRGFRKVGGGVVESFYHGFNTLATDYDYICKMDGDLTIGPKYFQTLLEKFDKDPKLGSASGKLFLDVDGKLVEERITDESVLGGVLCLRKECFLKIKGFVNEVMWDGIAFHRCRMEGYRTRSFRDKEMIITDHRIMGSSDKSIYHGRIRWGWGQYFMGTHPLYIIALGIYRMFERPFLTGGLLIITGYLKGFLKLDTRYNYPGFRKSLHSWQLERLKLGRRVEIIN